MHTNSIRLGMVLTTGAYLSSVGAMVDSYALTDDRSRQLFLESHSRVSGVEFRVMSTDGHAVKIGGDIRYEVDSPICWKSQFDFIWLPAFRFKTLEVCRQRLDEAEELIRWLRHQMSGGAIIGASGASTLFLVKGGFLEGQQVPFSPLMAPVVKACFPRCRIECNEVIADYGNIFIADGIANELALITDAIARAITPDSARWLAGIAGVHRTGGGYLANDPLVTAAQLRLDSNFTNDISIAELAKDLATTHQTLISRFKAVLGMSPKAYVQQQRLVTAKRLLINSRRSVEEIARTVGYSDARAFRVMFKKQTGDTATAWRQRHKGRIKNWPLNYKK